MEVQFQETCFFSFSFAASSEIRLTQELALRRELDRPPGFLQLALQLALLALAGCIIFWIRVVSALQTSLKKFVG